MSKSAKTTTEDKIFIVQECLSGNLSVLNAANMCKVVQSAVRGWIRLYKQEGHLGFIGTRGNQSYSPELKRQAVEAYLSGKGGLESICEEFKIRSNTQLREWIKVYNGGKNFKKISGGSRMKTIRKTTQEERIQIARDCLESGLEYGDIALKYGVSYQQVYTWARKYKKLGEVGLEDRRGQRTAKQEPRTSEEEMQIAIAQLKHENYLLKMERDLLKKLEELERRDAFRK